MQYFRLPAAALTAHFPAMRGLAFFVFTLLLAAHVRAVQLGVDRLQADGFRPLAGRPFPFEIVCSKWLDAGTFTARMRSLGLPGVIFDPITFEGKQGSRIRLSPRSPVNFAALGVQLLSEVNRPASPDVFARYHDMDGIFWKIYGSTSIRSQLASTAPERIAAAWESGVARFKAARQGYLIYQ